MDQKRLTRSEAQQLWNRAMQQKGWETRLIALVMFDWPSGQKTHYHPNPPVFESISDRNGTVGEQDYIKLQNQIVAIGERHSARGRKHAGVKSQIILIPCEPIPISPGEIQEAIQNASNRLHPQIALQEQVLRCGFIAALPLKLQSCIGTLTAAVHPELPTPSRTYQRKGKTERRARIDLGFGHPTDCSALVGAVELKALRSFSTNWFGSQIAQMASTPRNLMFSGLAGDFQKVLDPKIPNRAFRCSWAVTKQRSSESPAEIASLANALIQPVEQRLLLTRVGRTVDDNSGWLLFEWNSGAVLHLAWYWPTRENPDKFEPVWRGIH
jgi:hypothetical protein